MSDPQPIPVCLRRSGRIETPPGRVGDTAPRRSPSRIRTKAPFGRLSEIGLVPPRHREAHHTRIAVLCAIRPLRSVFPAMTIRLAAVHLGVCVALSIAAVTLASAQTPQQPQWAGWARCQITVSRSRVTSDTQTHTWTMGGAPSVEGVFRVYPGTWSVVGGGTLQSTQGNQTRVAQWARTVTSVSAPIAVFVRASDGRMFIQARHAQLRAARSVNGFQQLTIDGVAQKPGPIDAEAFEWAFPTIEVGSTNTTINGSSTPAVTGSVGLMQPAGSQGTASCTWQFGQGASAPAPPPTLNAQAIPTPPVTTPTPPVSGSQLPPSTSPTTSLPTTSQPRSLPGAPPSQGLTAIAPCTLRGPAITPFHYGAGTHLVPNAAYLEWSGVPGATGYNVYRSDLGLLTPTPLAPTTQQGQSYTHRALLGDGQFTYRIVALYANGCGLTETTERSKVNSMSLALSLSSNVGQVNIVWSVPQDPDVSGAIIQGPGLPPGAQTLSARRNGRVVDHRRATPSRLAFQKAYRPTQQPPTGTLRAASSKPCRYRPL